MLHQMCSIFHNFCVHTNTHFSASFTIWPLVYSFVTVKYTLLYMNSINSLIHSTKSMKTHSFIELWVLCLYECSVHGACVIYQILMELFLNINTRVFWWRVGMMKSRVSTASIIISPFFCRSQFRWNVVRSFLSIL